GRDRAGVGDEGVSLLERLDREETGCLRVTEPRDGIAAGRLQVCHDPEVYKLGAGSGKRGAGSGEGRPERSEGSSSAGRELPTAKDLAPESSILRIEHLQLLKKLPGKLHVTQAARRDQPLIPYGWDIHVVRGFIVARYVITEIPKTVACVPASTQE